MSSRIPLLPRMYFSYDQFMVYDSAIRAPGCVWTDAHVMQGFAKRESTVCFGTLLEFGFADVSWIEGPYDGNQDYERVVSVPFVAVTGEIAVDGPDEIKIERLLHLPVGNYQIVAAQRVLNEEEEVIDLFIDRLKEPISTSRVLVADALLSPPRHLLESAETA
jgi:hypothetical protein